MISLIRAPWLSWIDGEGESLGLAALFTAGINSAVLAIRLPRLSGCKLGTHDGFDDSQAMVASVGKTRLHRL